VAAPQDEVLNPHGEERGNAARLEPWPWRPGHDSTQPEYFAVSVILAGIARLRQNCHAGVPSIDAGKLEMNYLLVFIGGGLGSTLRHVVNIVCPRFLGTAFPYHTFIINITGSTIMGLIAGYLAFKGEASQPWRLFLMTGILGGYTTFSAFSLDAALLYERGEIGLALFYVLGSVAFSIAGLFAGLALVRHLT
jgi:CrcB protein